MKILHTGDLHLDSAFHSLTERQAEIRKNELRAAFTSMMTYARMNDISLALFAGDVFDSAYATRETLSLLAAEFARFGRPVVIATGNHDPSGTLWNGVDFPDNVTILGKPEMQRVVFPELNCEVWGYGFDTQNLDKSPLEGFRLPDPDCFSRRPGGCCQWRLWGYSALCTGAQPVCPCRRRGRLTGSFS